jgi:hypothetical protein
VRFLSCDQQIAALLSERCIGHQREHARLRPHLYWIIAEKRRRPEAAPEEERRPRPSDRRSEVAANSFKSTRTTRRPEMLSRRAPGGD